VRPYTVIARDLFPVIAMSNKASRSCEPFATEPVLELCGSPHSEGWQSPSSHLPLPTRFSLDLPPVISERGRSAAPLARPLKTHCPTRNSCNDRSRHLDNRKTKRLTRNDKLSFVPQILPPAQYLRTFARNRLKSAVQESICNASLATQGSWGVRPSPQALVLKRRGAGAEPHKEKIRISTQKQQRLSGRPTSGLAARNEKSLYTSP
jgi:hypothetical protein